jgi:hypothetical protein
MIISFPHTAPTYHPRRLQAQASSPFLRRNRLPIFTEIEILIYGRINIKAEDAEDAHHFFFLSYFEFSTSHSFFFQAPITHSGQCRQLLLQGAGFTVLDTNVFFASFDDW